MKITKEQRKWMAVGRIQNLTGLAQPDVLAILRAERALHRWAELECGTDRGHIERRENENNKPYLAQEWQLDGGRATRTHMAIPDREAGAIRRINAIIARYPSLTWYHQTDCRGCMVYVLRKTDIRPGESVDSIYTRGVAIMTN